MGVSFRALIPLMHSAIIYRLKKVAGCYYGDIPAIQGFQGHQVDQVDQVHPAGRFYCGLLWITVNYCGLLWITVDYCELLFHSRLMSFTKG